MLTLSVYVGQLTETNSTQWWNRLTLRHCMQAWRYERNHSPVHTPLQAGCSPISPSSLELLTQHLIVPTMSQTTPPTPSSLFPFVYFTTQFLVPPPPALSLSLSLSPPPPSLYRHPPRSWSVCARGQTVAASLCDKRR